ncbi:hypothetical protein [Bifidobacterium sp. SO4]|uniref:hypothetical protein n=1 Tax=Bifidobacterium sp. SO4 TaxID=2809030 RepID=UPI001BDD8A35|nr:hypothetical protein [Bifidobacterium sp. SO4]MBT1171244.1 hypothetical protein [Bifidobacterium sp. SO4]
MTCFVAQSERFVAVGGRRVAMNIARGQAAAIIIAVAMAAAVFIIPSIIGTFPGKTTTALSDGLTYMISRIQFPSFQASPSTIFVPFRIPVFRRWFPARIRGW